MGSQSLALSAAALTKMVEVVPTVHGASGIIIRLDSNSRSKFGLTTY